MVRVGILGATGYTGVELIRILSNHEDVQIKYLSSQNFNGKKFEDVYPSLKGFCKVELQELNIDDIVENCDVVFTALPSGYAMNIAEKLCNCGVKLIDLGADFRFDDFKTYKKWYETDKDDYGSVSRVYGLPEIHRQEIKNAMVVGNPGCYPTSVILGLAPALKGEIIENHIIIDSKSGVSGAGHSPKLGNMYAECNESIKPYNVAKHRHIPEIEQELSNLNCEDTKVIFTPHLTPMTRGILSTMYCKLKKDISIESLHEIYSEFYKDEYFVKVLDIGEYPSTKSVYGSNFCHIGLEIDKRTGTLIVMSSIDNLVKGASGQAVQNMNIMFGIDEDKGLKMVPVFP
ncbi:N-acetyl-gamma-glutamyl-phosphate reductase [Thermoanaerobacterium butyriciformans]|uniref:N-acetyl-gamma-glutamyl-phosphate reductase n=1 Tax=Thermoanaerobacterium butyriciformans TaxID=1702242 RepID=A0ABS4NHP0_9THEO|nr:N-acetyl-gamma-glutamyl-phosphate reductase [Thermoanaerobacterium butyriciformans]MBP2073186.1 N-acetyl-gamma-glutamyl-phosphate reductase [Thermoanaerobacterium butyriciformans]